VIKIVLRHSWSDKKRGRSLLGELRCTPEQANLILVTYRATEILAPTFLRAGHKYNIGSPTSASQDDIIRESDLLHSGYDMS